MKTSLHARRTRENTCVKQELKKGMAWHGLVVGVLKFLLLSLIVGGPW